MRLFVAVDLPGEMRDKLTTLLARLKQEITGVGHHAATWVRAEGIHLTLRFLGEVGETELPRLRAALSSVADAAVHRFDVTVEGLGLFPERGRPRVLWIGLNERTGALAALQHRVERAVREAGLPDIKSEERSFRPHLTLARLGETKPSIPIRDFVEAGHAENLGTFEVSAVTLFQSLPAPGGAQYRTIQEYRL